MMSASYRWPVPMSKPSKNSHKLLRRLEERQPHSASEDSVQPQCGGGASEQMARVRGFLTTLLGRYAADDVNHGLRVTQV